MEADTYNRSVTRIRVADVFGESLSTFWNFEYFNEIQSIVLDKLVNSEQNVAIAAPTGCGKTVAFDLAICQLLHSRNLASIQNKKILYLAPSKALCQERLLDWQKRLKMFGLRCVELTGDVDLNQCFREIAQASLIVATPEKWDSITRHWREHIFLLGSISLLLIDEVHHLSDDRGFVLETIVCRSKMLHSVCSHKNPTSSTKLRIIAVSATLPNIDDVGEWIECIENDGGVFSFPAEFRPVPLETHVFGYAPSKNEFLFDRYLDSRVADVISRFSNKRSTLVFCGTKSNSESLAIMLSKSRSSSSLSHHHHPSDLLVSHPQLMNCIERGVGFHNAGLPHDDRVLVETMFLDGRINVLCATTTLATGVNLPAHLVIVKGTTGWRGSSRGYEQLNRSTVMQMIGRAGRPGFDTSGTAVIMTSSDDKCLYEQLVSGQEVVESVLHKRLAECINSEISQMVIVDVDSALSWIKSTYLYIRVKKNPLYYGVSGCGVELEGKMREMCSKYDDDDNDDDNDGRCLNQLQANNIIIITPNLLEVKPTQLCHIMNKYIVSLTTMELILKLVHLCDGNDVVDGSSPQAGIYSTSCFIECLLYQLCEAKELERPLRRSEKKFLNDVMCSSSTARRVFKPMSSSSSSVMVDDFESPALSVLNACPYLCPFLTDQYTSSSSSSLTQTMLPVPTTTNYLESCPNRSSKQKAHIAKDKIYCLMQCVMQGIVVNDFAMKMEGNEVFEVVGRQLLPALLDVSLSLNSAIMTTTTFFLLRSCRLNTWGFTMAQKLSQAVGSERLTVAQGELICCSRVGLGLGGIMNLRGDEINSICGKKAPFGETISEIFHNILSKSLNLTAVECKTKNSTQCSIQVTLTQASQYEVDGDGTKFSFSLSGGSSMSKLVMFRKFRLSDRDFTFSVDNVDISTTTNMLACLWCDDFFVLDCGWVVSRCRRQDGSFQFEIDTAYELGSVVHFEDLIAATQSSSKSKRKVASSDRPRKVVVRELSSSSSSSGESNENDLVRRGAVRTSMPLLMRQSISKSLTEVQQLQLPVVRRQMQVPEPADSSIEPLRNENMLQLPPVLPVETVSEVKPQRRFRIVRNSSIQLPVAEEKRELNELKTQQETEVKTVSYTTPERLSSSFVSAPVPMVVSADRRVIHVAATETKVKPTAPSSISQNVNSKLDFSKCFF